MPDYEKLADEVRALIASRAFHTPEAIEDLLQLAACYEARAAGLEKTPEFQARFKLPAADSDKL